ncbi:MAG: hypothetical protein ACR2PG_25835 [Hyphomicrobiaceae bacterium]
MDGSAIEQNREELMSGIVTYFNSDHWRKFLTFHVENPDAEIWHSHLYLNTSVHPESLRSILEGYFAAQGRELMRCIDFLTPNATSPLGALHNVHPCGLPHFDVFFRYEADVVLGPLPADLAEGGQNMLSWGKQYMDRFYSQFAFQAMGPSEESEIDEYFASRHWKQTLNLILDPDVIHLHCNVRLGIDPKILELKARAAFERQGWTIDRIVPNVFQVRGAYRGKLVFLGRHPERVYDIGWLFDPAVIVAPSYEPWARNDVQLGFDLCFTSEFDALIARNPFAKLTDVEISDVVNSIA